MLLIKKVKYFKNVEDKKIFILFLNVVFKRLEIMYFSKNLYFLQ